MSEQIPVVTLLTDFGEADGFVGVMKGVITDIAPAAKLIDLTHLVSPQDVKQAAYILMTSTPYFPDGTIHMIVVDPGVGSHRRAIAVQTPTAYYVAPDNGVLTYVLAAESEYRAVDLAKPEYHLPEVSSTFHGRDIFSPGAGHLAAGVPIEDLGPAIDDLIMLDVPRLKVHHNHIQTEVLRVDHFGNIRTSMTLLTWADDDTLLLRPRFKSSSDDVQELKFAAKRARVSVGGISIDGVSHTFTDVAIGQPLAYVGSEGALDISINQGNAARAYTVKEGDLVTIDIVD